MFYCTMREPIYMYVLKKEKKEKDIDLKGKKLLRLLKAKCHEKLFCLNKCMRKTFSFLFMMSLF